MWQMEFQHKLLLNLRNRMEYNERTKLWSLKGSITSEEHKAFNEAIDALYTCIMNADKGGTK